MDSTPSNTSIWSKNRAQYLSRRSRTCCWTVHGVNSRHYCASTLSEFYGRRQSIYCPILRMINVTARISLAELKKIPLRGTSG